MRVAVDATSVLSTSGRTGVGVVTAELLKRLAPEVDLVAYATTGRHPRAILTAPLPDGTHRASWWRWVPAQPLRMGWSHLHWPKAESFTGPVDVVHGTNMVVPPTRRAGQVVTVHDLALVRYPDACARTNRRDPGLLQQAIDNGALVHTFSEYVADEVVSHFRAKPADVVAIPPGPPTVAPADPDLVEEITHGAPYVVALGTLQERKDLPTLVAAFEQLLASTKSDLHLVLVGGVDHSSERVMSAIRGSKRSDRIHCKGEWVGEARKGAILRGAAVLVYPSRYEGFGLPVLEAMVAGVPVVTTTAGALPEVSGDAALRVHPGAPGDLADAIASVLDDPARRNTLIQAGYRNLERFSWGRFTSDMLELYERSMTPPDSRT